MGIFNKNPNETLYAGGKKHWADVIKNSGRGDLLIWRQPEEDFNTNSTLIVMPGEKAIFIKRGIIEQVFDNGTYKLSTENYPFISRLKNAFTGGISTFNCVVYFVRSADSQEIRWGTDSPIQVRDKFWGVRTEARVRGAYKVRIDNPAMFLEKFLGNNTIYETQDGLLKYFGVEFQGRIKSAVSKYLNALNQELIGIDAYMDEISGQIEPYINEALSDYGIRCVKFTLAGLDIDTSKYDKMDEAVMQKQELNILGEDWNKVKGVGILSDVANNPGAGGIAAAGAGLGMGIGTAGVFGSIAQQVFTPVNNSFGAQQPANPMQTAPSGRFTQAPAQSAPEQAAPAQAAPAEDPFEALSKLKRFFDASLITEAEYEAKKAEILSRM